jgi:predicted helicase
LKGLKALKGPRPFTPPKAGGLWKPQLEIPTEAAKTMCRFAGDRPLSQLLINNYLNELDRLKKVSGAARETVVREAFKDLLKAWGRGLDLTFIPEHEFISPGKVRNYVDGALLHELRVPFGYWEAKDEDDDLDAEIAKKFRRGYPKSNIIFEDSRQAVLIQHGEEVARCPVDDVAALQHLLELFFGYERAEIADFRKAIAQFKQDLPAVLEQLRRRIDDAYAENPGFKQAAQEFLDHARQAVNPGLGESHVREMLIQHILTEDIFARVFSQDDFHRENNVAKALYALEAKFFRGDVKQQTLRALEPYYAAIRSTAALISSHSEKQGFLKALYENFYKVYNPAAADRLGVVYTPGEIVRFMVQSADWLCEKHFGKSLIDQGVEILDPATGTGTFIVELLEHFRGQPEKLKAKYREELHANEVDILPYYVANLNIEATYAALTGEYVEFPNLCFVDTLDNVAALSMSKGATSDLFGSVSEENVERIRRQNSRKISVVIGNPPYNANQQNENDNNKNRTYRDIDARIKATYIKESTAQKTKLYDMYSRFFRWASDRIADDGVIAFITNRGFLDKRNFDGFRKIIARDFSAVYILDLGGDVRDNPKLSGTTHNVFGIQTGVAVSFLVRRRGDEGCVIRYGRRPEFELSEDKLAFLHGARLEQAAAEIIRPDAKGTWLNQAPISNFADFIPIASKEVKGTAVSGQETAVFKLFSLGVVTSRDEWVYDKNKKIVINKVSYFIKIFESNREKWRSSKESIKINDFVTRDIKWTSELEHLIIMNNNLKFNAKRVVKSLYRPFSNIYTYYDKSITHRLYKNNEIYPVGSQWNNKIIIITSPNSQKDWMTQSSSVLVDLHYVGAAAGTVCMPLYRYTEDGSRIDNITDWALEQFAGHYGAGADITKDDIFAYVYAVLHDPTYREKYAVNLKQEFPRIPFYPDFFRWRDWGRTLLDLHIGYETMEPFPLTRIDTPDDRARAAGQTPAVKLKSDPDKGVIVVDSETQLSGVPPAAWRYVLGNRTALDWVLDQHKEKTPKDPTIREKFNTYRFADYKEQAIDLLRRVTTVSVKTMEIIDAMKNEA